ncbi:MAG TPA: cytochrome c nitrite reductase small subunit [bacterium]|nr:cytochrome c nitrite reductase small subunit [bacterium]
MHHSLLARTLEQIWPPPAWRLPVLLLSAFMAGLGALVLHLARATSYLSDDPVTCMNCHVMSPQYATWQRSSHNRAAGCNDCHVPHISFFRHYAFKAQDGLRHSFMFTFRLEPQVIRIKSAGAAVVAENCVRCHQQLVERLPMYANCVSSGRCSKDAKRCVACHQETPHGRVNSLGSTPMARVPRLTPAAPEWLMKR